MEQKNIALAAPLSSFSGYGQYARSISMMLIHSYSNDENIKLFLFDLPSQTISLSQLYDIKESKYKQLVDYIQPLQNIQKQFFDIFMTVSIPMAFLQKGLVNIGITALAEVDKIHPQLIEHCNRMDEVFVMSDFNIDSLKRSVYKLQDEREIKLNVPVQKISPAYIETDIIENKSDITSYIDDIPQQFLFVAVGQWLPGSIGADRKDIGALISSFLRGFGNNKDIGLLLKVDQGKSSILSQYSIRQRLLQICNGIGLKMDICNVHFISGDLTDNQMQEIYNHDKVRGMVSFTHAQSFGLPMMQFSGSTGKPMIVPYHSGLVQYIKPQYVEVLIHKQTQVPQELFQSFMRDFIIPQSRWYTIDYQYALFKMAEFIKNYSLLLQRGKMQQQTIKQEFSLQNMSKLLQSHLSKYINY